MKSSAGMKRVAWAIHCMLASKQGDMEKAQYWAQRATDVWRDEKTGNLNAEQLFTLGNNTVS